MTVRHGLKLLIDSQPDMAVVCGSERRRRRRSAGRRAQTRSRRDGHLDARHDGTGRHAKAEKRQPHLAIVTLTRHSDDAYLQELLRAGAAGYVLKQSAPSELLQAIRAAAAGGQYLDSALTARVTAKYLAAERKTKAESARERTRVGGAAVDCIRLQQQGNRGAGWRSASRPIEAHKANAMRKLGLTGASTS